ncbi:alpha/beta fold hydrolase [Lentzea sp. NPDC092896]|uniref:alpha/beta fold hydrolase n=1 Tax=Lentzea sp. NPDC092896 TaxID=3364127 RepID=UPI00382C9B32
MTNPITSTVVVDDGTEIAVHRWDSPVGDLPPVLLQHGFISNTLLEWAGRGMVAALLAAGRTVIGVDARGHGASQKSPDPARYGEERMAADLRTVIARLDVPAVDLVGYSMGSVVSAITASREPLVRRLVLGGTGAGLVELGGVDTRVIPTADLAEALLTDDLSSLPPALAAFRGFADAVGSDRPSLAAQALAAHAGPVDLGAITAPTLVIAGDADPLATRPEVLAAAIPGASLRLVAGDHMTAGGSLEFHTTVIEFLAETQESGS